MKQFLTFLAFLFPVSTFALEMIREFEWFEPNNSIEIVVGEPYQLKFNCTNNSLPFTSDYADYWNHYDFSGGQHMVNPPTGYSINDKGVITGLIPGSYAIKFTGYIQPKSGVDKMLLIKVVSERSESESNNTLDTANDITTKIRFGLYNISDVDYFKFTNNSLKWGDEVTFKIHYYGSRENPFGYKWATFSGTDMVASGSLNSQDQQCRALVVSSNSVYLEVYYDQSRSEYFNYNEEFVAEVYINGILASEYGNNDVNVGFDGDGTEDSPYIIKSADNLSKLSSLVNSGNSYSDYHFELADNIDMNGVSFEPIGNQDNPFSGYFDGKGYVIKGISVNAVSYIGLFGLISGANINDITIEGASFTGSQNIGAIAGCSYNSVITNCYTRGSTMGNDNVGAIVGYSGDGTVIQNSFSSMQHTKYEITGNVGGLVGYNCGTIENSYYCGTINARIYDKRWTGGIVGYNNPGSNVIHSYYIKTNSANSEFDFCGSLNWGNCYGIDTFDLYGVTTSGNNLYELLNTWVDDHSDQGRYRKWSSQSYPKFIEYAIPEEHPDVKEYVDLGLPSGLLWATTNVGAKRPEEYGSYFAWGETSPKSEYSWATYKYANGSETSLTKYCTSYSYGDVDNKETLEEDDDAASVNWGKPWRTPTLSETQELISYCTWTFTTINGVNGYKVLGSNGNSIFLPAAGAMQYDFAYKSGTGSCVQSSTIFNASNGKPSSASVLLCEEGAPHWWYGWSRCWGYPVRPVTSKDPSGIIKPSVDDWQEIIGIYDVQGHKIEHYRKGLNIIKYKNGTTNKIVVQ